MKEKNKTRRFQSNINLEILNENVTNFHAKFKSSTKHSKQKHLVLEISGLTPVFAL